MSENRTNNSLKTAFSGYIMQIITVLLSFVNRSVFIYCLNVDYLGINGLFSSVLSVLALSELGIGTAITFHLYKPISENDIEHIRKLTEFYKTCYRIIGMVIIGLGVLVMPFLHLIVNLETDLPINLYVVYILYLFNTAASYLFFAYFQTVVIAHQKQYLVNNYKIIFKVITSVVCCVLLLITRNYYFYLGTQIVLTFVQNWCIRNKTLRIFPFLKNTKGETIDKYEVQSIKKDMFSIMITRISTTLTQSFDSMIISTFVSTTMVGLVSNYLMIVSNVVGISNQLITSATAGVGNLLAKKDQQKSYSVFKELDFLNYYIMYFITICLCVLTEPFIELWLGAEYVINQWVLYFLVFSYYIRYSLNTVWMYKDGLGLFKYGRFTQLIQGSANIIMSILLCNRYGAIGVYAATFITSALISWPLFTYYVFKIGLNQSVFKRIVEMAIRTAIIIGAIGLIKQSVFWIHLSGWCGFVGQVFVCVFVSNIIFILLFFRSSEFRGLLFRVKNIVQRAN